MKLARLVFLVSFLLVLASCGPGRASPSAQMATPQPTVPPVPTPPKIPFHEISFTTSDHVKLLGLLYGQGKTMIICSHMSQSTLADWRESGIPERLAALGYQVLLYNFRGNGGSDGNPDPTTLNVDLTAAVNFSHQRGATKIVLMGASMGGTASLNVATNQKVAAVISLSGPQAFGVNVTDADLKKMTVPKLFIASQDDEPYVSDAKHMDAISANPKEMYIYPGENHGTDILGGSNGDDPALRILHFIQQYAPAS
ncbi:MAG: alpha/beta fold hydrolase [Chloroflexi bacterium]|nr:alpha/beta fold hydrolase [Chloroflexota bacterium]